MQQSWNFFFQRQVKRKLWIFLPFESFLWVAFCEPCHIASNQILSLITTFKVTLKLASSSVNSYKHDKTLYHVRHFLEHTRHFHFVEKKTFMTTNNFHISRNDDFSYYNSLNAFNYSLKFSRNTSFKNNIFHLSTMEERKTKLHEDIIHCKALW